ncbi:2,5-diketo-D-gluconic acid reductase A [Oxobacter pfennigii]|uniref:2,5-diketo-D-gluconic acid reductase A n=1 Tax=Oxobacter pfennigii TaxID=36849 RepID=A0A0N8NTI8_9CLOT|nr:aldo/keto reductase [Oxobacter pfennigii]KPU44952.1 2,5-diketo-D-gluconic acid reductase A [Oxobacter pfennigii]
MEYKRLGSTNLEVSRLCFGTLTIGPMQAKKSIEDGANIIVKAIEQGINFFDTAKLYNTYGYLRRAMEIMGKNDIIISSRSYDYTYDGMKESINEALTELNLPYIDIFGLHEQESIYTLRGHSDALKCLIDAKNSGLIKAISLSTHNVSGVKAACDCPQIDIIHPILNYKGIGIVDGGVKDMLNAIKTAKSKGKGIYSMKPIAGGNLIGHVKECFDFVLNNEDIDSTAVGMQSVNEVTANVLMFERKEVPDYIANDLRETKRRLLIDSWCEGCGACAKRCSSKALCIKDGKSQVNMELCRLCGYCSTVCPQFCIKII